MLKAIAVLLLGASTALAGRYEDYIKRVHSNPGPPMKTISATLLGGEGDEGFVGGGIQRDGTVVLIGQSVGPQFLPGMRPTVWGDDARGERTPPTPDRRGRVSMDAILNPGNTMSAGFVLRYSPDMKKLVSSARFGYGIASASGGAVGKDGSIYVAGRCSEATLRQFAGRGGPLFVSDGPAPANNRTGFTDAYVAKVSSSGEKIEWIHVIRNAAGGQGRVLLADTGVFLDVGSVYAISFDGRQSVDLKIAGSDDKSGVTISADGKTIIRGGDRNTNTGREPYRNPYLHIHDGRGNRQTTLWNWDSKVIGSDKYRLVSDSSPRRHAFDPKGNLVIAGWSDGGNTVFNREPNDLDASHGKFKGKFIDSAWGMNVGSLTTIMVLDPKTNKVIDGTLWISFVPDDKETFGRQVNKPNNAGVDAMGFLDDGSLVITGTAATGIIETKDSWYRYPGKGRFGGWYLAVLTSDYRDLRFCSYMPDTGNVTVIPVGEKLLVVGAAKRNDQGVCDAPSANALQTEFGGGTLDGHVILMEAVNK